MDRKISHKVDPKITKEALFPFYNDHDDKSKKLI